MSGKRLTPLTDRREIADTILNLDDAAHVRITLPGYVPSIRISTPVLKNIIRSWSRMGGKRPGAGRKPNTRNARANTK